ncbi:methyltransferase type 11 [Candidatus Woesebacteria bacterium RBG_13_34_9]|uniref:Methyltransferase type 11 n=1 Tax=Candidatus Woesebacteria bacterium RBG_13_34_9 TaxID=1802477 RepID=A0A1F7WZD7_9BACT|nr:MAG: methyltransferase type 11 [Candidatus Woesebacteria bacterium RBG_13_34_9]
MLKLKPRVIETGEGIQGDFNVITYDKMQRRLRDKGWIETNRVIAFGIDSGLALEIGPGPGYLGLEWLKKTTNTNLKCVEISGDMIKIAEKNTKEYHFTDRVEYKEGKAEVIPFSDNMFDAVFTNGSLHEWPDPMKAFNEIYRVLKRGGKFFISDLRRDMNPFMAYFLKINSQPKEIRPGLISSIHAAYTKEEIVVLLNKTPLKNALVSKNMIGIEIKGDK